MACNPYTRHPIHRGPYYARNYMGYAPADVAALPQVAADRFVGVGNPFSVDVVISNGALSLAADKVQVLRVLKSGGRRYLAEVVLAREPPLEARHIEGLWAACIDGAMVEEQLPELAARVGLRHSRWVGCYDCFRNAPVADNVPGHLKAHGVTFMAIK